MRITDTDTLPDSCAGAAPGKRGFYKRQGFIPRHSEAQATELPTVKFQAFTTRSFIYKLRRSTREHDE